MPRKVVLLLVLVATALALAQGAAAATTIDNVTVSGKKVTATGTTAESTQTVNMQLGVVVNGAFAPTPVEFNLNSSNFSDGAPGDGIKTWIYTWDQEVNGTYSLSGEGFVYGTQDSLKTFSVDVVGNMEQARIISINGTAGAGNLVAGTAFFNNSPGGSAPDKILTVLLSAPGADRTDGGIDLSQAGYAAGTTVQLSIDMGNQTAYVMRNIADTVNWKQTGNALSVTAQTVSSYLQETKVSKSVMMLAAVVNPQLAPMAGVTVSTNSPNAEFLPPTNRNAPSFGLQVSGPSGTSGFFEAILPGTLFRNFGMPVQGLQLLKNNTEQTAGATVTLNADGGAVVRFVYTLGSGTQTLRWPLAERRPMATLVIRVVLTKVDRLAPVIQGFTAKASRAASVIGFRISEKALVTVAIVQGKTLIQQIKIARAAGGNRIIWNNKSRNGKRVAAGNYQAKIWAVDAKKNGSKVQTIIFKVP